LRLRLLPIVSYSVINRVTGFYTIFFFPVFLMSHMTTWQVLIG
jgi:hypothetical protein